MKTYQASIEVKPTEKDLPVFRLTSDHKPSPRAALDDALERLERYRRLVPKVERKT